ncbi:hypothetical protein BMT55_12220 [Listeria newyorkensis]|uniref:Transposase n=1 Tax=Listeria newyorkensis TaxID=1497681 RepID=A0ABX4XL81_9LIST|nr:hypothetical protein EP56_15585 [Listeriaceae bacterium FSL A5-0209]KGL46018.1 hypothetical protein EP58_02445 [Listeria newyorkensis]PNP90568.1 hypothetical protein BMT55_12220 [Listeria newyorkensis]RQW67922.1 hypothetical protein DUK53_00635 [Listeria sp. SHR_NRA_18]
MYIEVLRGLRWVAIFELFHVSVLRITGGLPAHCVHMHIDILTQQRTLPKDLNKKRSLENESKQV